uniref:Spermatogenesis-associated serine-rich protein 2 n=1 Tax=Falco tinnunculus TaxID=100819 RepID=A0A8C4UQA3_FALTI
MAQGGTFENMKEKINAVRAIVPNRSNNEIVLVLQHFDNCVDKTVQAFMEGNASEVLKEWTVTGKKKNKKKKTKPKPQAESNPGLPEPGKLVSTEEEQSANSEKGGINGFHVNGCAHDTESVDSLSEGLDALSIDARELEDCEPAAPDMPDRTVPELENGIADFDTKSLIMHPSQSPSSLRQRPEQRSASRSLSRSAASNSTPASLSVTRLEDVPVSPASKKLGSNIEKSVKDLQRCTVSLARYRVVVKEEMDASIKKMKQAFAELQIQKCRTRWILGGIFATLWFQPLSHTCGGVLIDWVEALVCPAGSLMNWGSVSLPNSCPDHPKVILAAGKMRNSPVTYWLGAGISCARRRVVGSSGCSSVCLLETKFISEIFQV